MRTARLSVTGFAITPTIRSSAKSAGGRPAHCPRPTTTARLTPTGETVTDATATGEMMTVRAIAFAGCSTASGRPMAMTSHVTTILPSATAGLVSCRAIRHWRSPLAGPLRRTTDCPDACWIVADFEGSRGTNLYVSTYSTAI